jgi:hypothetical protein
MFRGFFTFLFVGGLIVLGAIWLVNHVNVNPPPSPIHIQNPPLATPISAVPKHPAALSEAQSWIVSSSVSSSGRGRSS